VGRGLLQGRVAVITGAGQGLGRAVSREYADEGAWVVLVERNPQTLDEARQELADKGHRVLGYALDITHHPAFREAMADVVAQWGHLDIIVNNAAISLYGTILEDNLEDWRAQIGVNLEAVYTCTKAVAPYMVNQKWGRVINVASIQGFASSGMCGAYNAAKGGVIAFTKSLAVELAPYNIAANVVAPGFMRTPMSFIDGVDETTTPDFVTWYVDKRHVPMARTGFPEDVAGTVVFLGSDYCRYMTGQVLVVDGGLTSTF
jgi:NAD(P)-dependent dehydrogenase (short-subunit alcohol dehydrogenase family)